MSKKGKRKSSPQHRKKSKESRTQKKKSAYSWWKNKRVLISLGVILIITFLALFPVLNNGFVNWDDQDYVLNNPYIDLNFSNIQYYFTHKLAQNYHPLTMLSLSIDHSIHSTSALGFHLTNLLLHLFNTFLVFLLFYRLGNSSIIVASIVAVFFGIHPMHVESVAWIAERKDVLYTAFFLLGMLSYWRYLKEVKRNFYWISLLFLLLSLWSKPAAVIFPIVLLLLDYLYGRDLDRKVFLEKLPFFVLAFIAGVITLNIQGGGIETASFSLGQKFLLASYSLVMYLWMFFVPSELSALHPYPSFENGIPLLFGLAPVLVLLIYGSIFYLFRKNRQVIFGMLFFLVNLALVLQFVQVGHAVFSERYTYVPYLGLLYILALGFERAWYTKKDGRYPSKPIAIGMLSLFLVIFAYLTHAQTQIWKDSETLWNNVLKKYPQASLAYYNRGILHMNQQNNEQALADFEQAIAHQPNHYEAYTNRGNVYRYLQQNDLAIENYNNALAIKPNFIKAINNRGVAYLNKKMYAQAQTDFDQVIQQDPNYTAAYINRAALYIDPAVAKYQLAIQDYNLVLSMESKNSQAFYGRGLAKQRSGQINEALNDYNQAINLNPNSGGYYLSRAYVFNALGDKAQALRDARTSQSLGVKVDQSFMNSLAN